MAEGSRSTSRTPLLEKKVDPFTVLTSDAQFWKLGYYEQLDAAVNNASKPDMAILPVFIIGGIFWCINAAVCLAITWYCTGEQLWSPGFHLALQKNVIAYHAIACHHGFHVCYRMLVGGPDYKVKFMPGSIKEDFVTGNRRRTRFDGVMHIIFDLSHVWLMISEPTSACAVLYFATTAWMYAFDHGEYIGMDGMFHGPWSVYILAEYATGGKAGAGISVLQFFLLLLYIGCGLGKMGPWFVSVFNQEWTLPPWAKLLDLKPLLYTKEFPRDNTPTPLAKVAGYFAATSEWVAAMLMMMTPAVGFGEAGQLSPYVACGVFIIVAMHIYINFHMPTFDTWMLNFTPAYLVYNAFYCNMNLPEPGFDWAGFSALAIPYQLFCLFFLAYCVYGHLFPENMTYMFCYRFWAGNWPMSWVLVTESGMEKLLKAFPEQAKSAKPGDVFAQTMGEAWGINFLGVFCTAQLPNRVMPMVLHKALAHGAKARGEKQPPASLGQFVKEQNGWFGPGVPVLAWATGWVVNDSLRGNVLLPEMQKECNFEAGEFVHIVGHSFPIFGELYNATSRWTIHDAKLGLIEEGKITVAEAIAVTRPSLWEGHETRGDKAMMSKANTNTGKKA